jgi:hypothetical protein
VPLLSHKCVEIITGKREMKGNETVGIYNSKDGAEFLPSCQLPAKRLDAARGIVEHV